MQIGLVGSSALLGELSFVWVYLIVLYPAAIFLWTSKENNYRLFTHFCTTASLVVYAVLLFTNAVPSVLLPQYQHSILYFGMFNVCYNAVISVIASVRFLNDTNRYQQLLEAKSLAMLQQAKMSSLGEMAAGVAHEINNPLGIIQGKIENLSRRLQQVPIDTEKVQADFARVSAVVARIAKIVGALRTFSRDADNDPFQNVKVDEIIEETFHFCGENLQRHGISIRRTGERNLQLECRST